MAGDKQEEPLKDEAQRRDEWRGGATRLQGDEGSGHSLPASEDDDEALGGGGRDEVAHPPTIAPPD